MHRREACQEALRVDEKNFSTSLTEAERLENCGINSCRLDRRVGVQEVAAQTKEEGGEGGGSVNTEGGETEHESTRE